MEPLKMFRAFFITQPQAPAVIEPGQRVLDNHPKATEAGAVCGVLGAAQLGYDPTFARGQNVPQPPISMVALKNSGPEPRPPARASHRRNGVEQFDGKLSIENVGGCHAQRQRNARGIHDQMAFTAVFGAVRGVRPRMRPPKTARKEALSTTARDRSMPPAFPRWRSIIFQSRAQMPAAVQSRQRLQHVGPLGASSAGMWFQPQPVRSTKRIPTRHSRAPLRGRPPLGLRFSGGKRGLISFHNSSVTHCRAIDNPLSWFYGSFIVTIFHPTLEVLKQPFNYVPFGFVH